MSDQHQTEQPDVGHPQQRTTKRDLMEQNFDKIVSREVSISDGGILFESMGQLLETAKLLATAGPLLPIWLQGNAGGCLGVMMQTMDWNRSRPPHHHISAIFAARMSFAVPTKGGGETVGFMSQMFAVLVNTSGLFKKRPEYRYEGTGIDQKCTVVLQFIDEDEAREHESPPLKDIQPKNSPLWTSDPRQQLGYYTLRAFVRRNCPEVLAGFHDEDEVPSIAAMTPAERAKDVSPETRFKGTGPGGEGWRADNVERGLAGGPMVTESELDEIAGGEVAPQPAGEGGGAPAQAQAQAPQPPEGDAGGKKPRKSRAKDQPAQEPAGAAQQPQAEATDDSSADAGGGEADPGGAAPQGGSTQTDQPPTAEPPVAQAEPPAQQAPPEPKAAPAPKPAAAAKPEPAKAGATPAPKTVAEYMVYTMGKDTPAAVIEAARKGGYPDVDGWVRVGTNVVDINDRWNSKEEKALRGVCGVIDKDFDLIRDYRNQRLDEIRNSQ